MRDDGRRAHARHRDGLAAAFGARSRSTTTRNYPVTFNHAEETVFAGDVAADVAGDANVHRAIQPVMGGEDFSYMLEARPGAFIFIGNGDTAGLHHPAYDFNDEVIPHGMSYWVRLAERRWPPDPFNAIQRLRPQSLRRPQQIDRMPRVKVLGFKPLLLYGCVPVVP